jgi:hypothetical protein
MGFIFRSARYDCLCLLLMSLVLLSYSLRSRRLRIAAIAILGVIAPLAGIQLILYSIVLCAVLVVFLRMRVFWEAIALGAGELAGYGALLLLFYTHGVLNNFHFIGQRVGHFQYVAKDPSFALLLAVCIVLVAASLKARSFRLHSMLGFGLVSGVVIPGAVLVLGKFPIYYSWMAYVPLALAVTGAMAETSLRLPRWALRLSVCGLCLVFLLGLPVQIASALYYWNNRDGAQIEALDQKNLKSDDWVYTEYSGYYAARRVTKHVFIPFVIPSRYRDRITVLVVSPADYEDFVHSVIGGDWRDTGAGIADTGHDLVPNSSALTLLQRRVLLRIYRRIKAPERH